MIYIYHPLNTNARADQDQGDVPTDHDFNVFMSNFWTDPIKQMRATCSGCGMEIEAHLHEPSYPVQILCRCGGWYRYDPAAPGQ